MTAPYRMGMGYCRDPVASAELGRGFASTTMQSLVEARGGYMHHIILEQREAIKWDGYTISSDEFWLICFI